MPINLGRTLAVLARKLSITLTLFSVSLFFISFGAGTQLKHLAPADVLS